MSNDDVELPQGYAERPFDYSGDLYIEGQVRAIIKANRALVSELDALRESLEALKAENKRLQEALRAADTALAKENSDDCLWRCTVCGRIGTVGRCCGEETRERVNMEQLLAENERLLRELRQETERRWEGNRRAAQEYVEDMRDVLREAAQICKDLDEEALAKEWRLACGAECAAAIAELAARWNVPTEIDQGEQQ